MPGVLPEGEPVPIDGTLPLTGGAKVGLRGFGVYVHVPYCSSRCGYCDFNTYTPAELRKDATPASGDRRPAGSDPADYVEAVLAELALAGRVLADTPPPRVDTVFVGGGTPTLLPPDDLARILDGIDRTWGLAAGAEVTTEANPESVTPESLKALAAAGYTRISLGMQSAAPRVLAVLDRQHRPGRAVEAARGPGTPGSPTSTWI
jgi:oxygen-independent coproporphyrinogen-3 oxidase